MGNTYTIDEFVWDEAGAFERTLWQGESIIAALWLTFKWHNGKVITLTCRKV
jgi:hypothetical protein